MKLEAKRAAMSAAERIASRPMPRVNALLSDYPQLHLRPMEMREERILYLACRLEQERGYLVELVEKAAHRPGFLGLVGTEFSNEIDAALAALSQQSSK